MDLALLAFADDVSQSRLLTNGVRREVVLGKEDGLAAEVVIDTLPFAKINLVTVTSRRNGAVTVTWNLAKSREGGLVLRACGK